MATSKDKLNEIINLLNENQLSEVAEFAEFIKNKSEKDFWNNLPGDNEPLTEEELQIVKEAEKDLKEGKTLEYDEVFEG